MKAKIYHNPRCSKSRATLALLRDRAVAIDVVDYLETPPSKPTLRELCDASSAAKRSRWCAPPSPSFDRMRGRALSDEEILDLLVAEPRLLQRPIVELGGRARIGRPPERVLELFE